MRRVLAGACAGLVVGLVAGGAVVWAQESSPTKADAETAVEVLSTYVDDHPERGPQGTPSPWSARRALARLAAFVAGQPDDAPPPPSTAPATTAPSATNAPPTKPAPTPTKPAPTGSGGWPSAPLAICGNASILNGPTSPPSGAVTVPAGDNSSFSFSGTGRTFWFAPGVHTLGTSEYDQIVPADGQTYIGAPGAIIDGQNRNLYAFTQHAVGVTVKNLTIRNFGTGTSNNNEGVVNHDAGDDWTIANNTITDNDGAGVFVGDGSTVRNNCLQNNGQYGFSAYEPDGVRSVVLEGNEIAGNNTDDWESRNPGCGCTGGGKFWDTLGARVVGNWIHDNASVGLWADTNNADFLIEGNWIEGNDGEAIFYETSFNATITRNVIKRNTLVKGQEFAAQDDSFPVAAIYLSESGGDERYPSDVSGRGGTIDVSNNLLEDNWSGIAVWENADRFCGSPANTSTGYCTGLGEATFDTCAPSNIDSEPHYTDCRWRSQNVKVHNNELRVTPSNIGCSSDACAKVAILSNWGTYPDWSPYTEDKVQRSVTFEQGNQFYANTYVGPWAFVAFEADAVKSFDEWRSDPFNQDADSTLN